MLGYVLDLAFFKVKSPHNVKGLNWRLMLGSAGVPALIVMSQVFFCPKSPQWSMAKGKYDEAFKALLRLRKTPLQAARDFYSIHVILEAVHCHVFFQLLSDLRCRRAVFASLILMFMQQFCGIHAVAYYSSTICMQSGFSITQALFASFGFGLVNFVFAFPAVHTIDTFGRRGLLLTSTPLMAIFLLLTGLAFFIPGDGTDHGSTARLSVVALGIYLFAMAYSPGLGPVPLTYSAEAYPLRVRDIGMSLSTATLWFFNFIVAITFPRLVGAFTPQGAFGWYAGWNIVGFILILLFVPETKALSLEDLDQDYQVFSVPTHTHASHQLKNFPYNVEKYVFRCKVGPTPPLYKHEMRKNTYETEKHDATGGCHV